MTQKKDTLVICYNYCSQYCKKAEDDTYKVGEIYGLTAKEKELAEKDPVKALKAYKLSLDAESSCLDIYASSQINDESDACRHYIWAATLYNEFGHQYAEEVLIAHELNPKQPSNQLNMDITNNKLGLESGKKLVGNKSFSSENVVKSF